ncbi:glycosyltransferase family 2 protein [candidate division TA06 bacterium]|uniref:Glycosyltransferase family 2 protein n=1 Tax=candidate division TA06 bacterium TaxID=2250710 RepID=A0A660S5Y7_UNCT6|nr:MAG: glycosyltransferase family 2 protein [candidate division TA06 bacterium]
MNMDKKHLLILLPAYNEERFIGKVIDKIRKNGFKNILVVDDGSNDNTYEIAVKKKVKTIKHIKNKGKGAALKTGLSYAYSEGYDFVAILDADNQHNPMDLNKLIREMESGNYDIIIGKRINYEKMPFIREITNKVTSLVISLLCKNRVMDSQSGFRLLKTKLVPFINLKTDRFEAESEMLIQIGRNGFHIGEIPVSTLYGNEKSSINPIIDAFRFIKMAVNYMWV